MHRYIKLTGILVAILGLALSGCQNAIDPAEETNQISSPNFTTAFSSEELAEIDIPLAAGSGIVAAGVGLRGDPTTAQPGDININVPGDVLQVILYWEGHMTSAAGDPEITVDGNLVAGTLIGGPTNFFSDAWSTCYRADITSLGVVSAGANSVSIGGMDYDRLCPDRCTNNGAGIIVIYDDGSGTADISIRDGLDLAFYAFDPPLDTTVPQTFSFGSSTDDRNASITLFASSIAPNRPNVVVVTVNGSETRFVDPFQNLDGPDWDTVVLSFNVPAGVTSATVQVLSAQDPGSQLTGIPASLAWLAAALEIAPEVDEPGDEGCTPGYWKNHTEDWPATVYELGNTLNTVFGPGCFEEDLTLIDALWHGGGGEWRLGRHGTAALLSALHPGVAYGLTVEEVIAAVNDGDADLLEYHNEMGCPLGRGGSVDFMSQ